MSKAEILEVIMLLSALESWSFAERRQLPEYLHAKLSSAVNMLAGQFLKDVPRSEIKDHEIAQLVNRLRDIAREFHGHESLRERIAHEVVPLLRRGDA